MKSLSYDLTRYLMYVVFSFLAVGISSCSSDDDADDIMEQTATGSITVEDNQTISQNTIIIQNVTVGQDSWVVAVMGGDESTNNFISEPVKIEAGTTSNVEIVLNDDVNLEAGETGNQISIKLYEDNPNEGNLGEWDESDEPIMDGGTVATETITVFVEDPSNQTFADFDTNSDGVLDSTEVTGIYANNFDEWDTDDDDLLDQDEFNTTTFSLTDMNDNDGVDEDEWNDGFASFFGNWNDDDFATFDEDADSVIDTDEWNNAFADSEWFGAFDSNDDTFLGEDEWDAGLFDDWDDNDDDEIDEDEFNIFSDFSMNW